MTEPVMLTRLVPASVEVVYRAWTDPLEMSKWFYVGDEWKADVVADVRVGGRFRIDMHTPSGDRLVSQGTYLELDPPHRLKMTWTSYAVTDTTVTIDLEPVGQGTRLTLTHEGLPDPASAQRHLSGWGSTLDNLAGLWPVDREES